MLKGIVLSLFQDRYRSHEIHFVLCIFLRCAHNWNLYSEIFDEGGDEVGGHWWCQKDVVQRTGPKQQRVPNAFTLHVRKLLHLIEKIKHGHVN